jgi:hypothetical protein
MSSVSGCQVACSWADVGCFHMRLFIMFMIFTVPVQNILGIPSYIKGHPITGQEGPRGGVEV